jgi:hypothetical protein
MLSLHLAAPPPVFCQKRMGMEPGSHQERGLVPPIYLTWLYCSFLFSISFPHVRDNDIITLYVSREPLSDKEQVFVATFLNERCWIQDIWSPKLVIPSLCFVVLASVFSSVN